MSGYELTVILEQGGIKVGQISADVDELRVVASVRLSGAPTAAVRQLSEVHSAYYSAGDSHRPAGICFTLTATGKELDRVAVARRVLGVVKGALS
jgi:hypothetical protein